METFSFSPTKNLVEEGKWFIAVTSFEATNFVFNKIDENDSFSIGTPGFCRIPNLLPYRIIDRLKELLELRIQNYIEILVSEVEKRGTRTEIEIIG